MGKHAGFDPWPVTHRLHVWRRAGGMTEKTTEQNPMTDPTNKLVIESLRNELNRERRKIENAELRIVQIQYELAELGAECDNGIR